MFEASEIKCMCCNIFYKPNEFLNKDIENMRKKNKFLRCKMCSLNYSSYYINF
jgi:hypothetical protein